MLQHVKTILLHICPSSMEHLSVLQNHQLSLMQLVFLQIMVSLMASILAQKYMIQSKNV